MDKKTITNPWYIFDNTTDQDDEHDCGNEKKQNFFFILKWFGNCFVNHKEYSILVQANSLFSEVATISDEAFGYFTLERCWDSWQTFKETNGEEQIENDHSVRKSNTKFGGWKQSGPERYTEIARLVKISRDTDLRKEIEREYKNQIWEQNNKDSSSKRTRKSDDPITFVAYNDLDEDEEDDDKDENRSLQHVHGNNDFEISSNCSSNGSYTGEEQQSFSNTHVTRMEAQTYTTDSQQTSSQDQNKSYIEGKINESEIFVTVISFLTHVLLQMM